MTVEAIKQAITALPIEQRHSLASWLNELDYDAWDEQMVEDFSEGGAGLALVESLLIEARNVAKAEGVALNQFINVAVAEKLSALRTEDYFRERAERSSVTKAKRLLARAGKGKPPVEGDEVG